MPTLAAIGKRFKAYLDHKEIGINQAGRDIGTSGAQISNIINGKKWGTDKLLSIINAYQDLSVEYLLLGKGEMLHNPNAQIDAQIDAQKSPKAKTESTHFEGRTEAELHRELTQKLLSMLTDPVTTEEPAASYRNESFKEKMLLEKISRLEAKNEALLDALEAIGRGQGSVSTQTA